MYQNFYENNSQKKNGPQDNYYGSAQRDFGQNFNNNNYKKANDDPFAKTKNKIKVILFKNGFIVNNGHFRDKSIPENAKFMAEVEKGMIPQELVNKGIHDLGILLENRKNEIYKKKPVNPISATLDAYIHGNLDNLNTNNINLNNLNYIPNDLNLNPNVKTEIKINEPIILKPGEDIPLHWQAQNDLIMQKYNNSLQNRSIKNNLNNNMPLTPIGRRNNRKNTFAEKNVKVEEEELQLKKRDSLSAPKKKEEKKFRTFASLIKEEKEKEEEEKKKKRAKKEQNYKEEKEEKAEEEKKFQAFTGTGKILGNISTQGLHVQKDIKNIVDEFSPICVFSIRLFNGEVVKCEFNYTQTLRDIYFYVQKISGSNNFHLLDGFPPKPLRDYDKQIGELHLDNTILTQKIK